MKKLMSVVLLCAFLTSCMSGPMDEVYQTTVLHPVHFVMPDGTAVTGQITKTGQQGNFVFQRPDNVTCAAYALKPNTYRIAVPCNDGSTAWVGLKPRTGWREATLLLPDGRIAQAIKLSPQYTSSSTSNQDALVSRAPSNDYCRNSNYYGATSCLTGLPKTQYVSGYYRKNGTYVRPYYRSNK